MTDDFTQKNIFMLSKKLNYVYYCGVCPFYRDILVSLHAIEASYLYNFYLYI